ncbi:MAG: hypothetical protein M3R70_00835 [Actinomycetota bacterium]|nr:hypothetical protein [Actinomycetota bacterium]
MKLFARYAVVAALCSLALLARPAAGRAWLTWFDFERVTNTGSVLTMTWQQMPGKFSEARWRAGSGSSVDACWIAHGWLPTGWYDLRGHWDRYDGSLIKGRVYQLQDKPCWNGTWRRELFIHSEETSDQGQYCPSTGDDPFCWESDFDYYSAGCVKVSRGGAAPTDLRLLHEAWHEKSGDLRHGAFGLNDFLYVHN